MRPREARRSAGKNIPRATSTVVPGMAQDKWDAVVFAWVSDPVPGEHAFDSDHDIFSERADKNEEPFTISLDVLVQPDLSCLIEDTELHFFRMKVDSAIKLT